MKTMDSGPMAPLLTGVLIAAVLLLVGCSGEAPSVEERLGRAEEQLDAGELRAASIELKNALQEAPDNADARLLLGRVSLRMGAGAAAEKEFRRAGELGKPPADIAYWLARAIQQQGDHQRLIEEVEVRPEWPSAGRARVLAVRAQAFAAAGDVDEARDALQRARDLGAEGVEMGLARARLAFAAQPASAAAAVAAEVTEAHPDSVRAWGLRARVAIRSGDIGAAEQHLGRAIEQAYLPLEERLMRARVRIVEGDVEAAREDVDWLGERMPDHPSFLMTRGVLAWASGEPQRACEDFSQVLGVAPDLRGARFYGGVCHYRAGEYNQAEANLREAYQGRASPRVARVLAATYLAQERHERAREVLRPVLQSNPEDRAALAMMAGVEAATGNSDEAVDLLRRLAELDPENPRVRLQLGAGLLETGELDEARAALSEALTLDPAFGEAGALLVMSYVQREEYDRALEQARAMSADRPDDPLPHVLEGRVHQAAGDRQAARVAFRTAVEKDGSDPGARHALARMALERDDLEAARSHYRAVLDARADHVGTLTALATLEGQAGNTEAAEDLLRRAYDAEPDALTPRLLLARLRFSRGQPADALSVLEGEDGEVPPQPEALVLASRARIAMGRYSQALPDIRRLLELRPDSTVPYVLLAQAQEATGQQEEALAQMREVLELDPDHPVALLVQARVHLREGETDPARELLARVPDEYREHPSYLDARGRLALREGRRDEALEYYRRAFDVAPSSETVTRLASFEQAMGNTERARRLLDGWVSDHSDDLEAQLALGDLHASLGEVEEAARAYREVLDRNPGSARALNNLGWVLRERDPAEALRYAEQAVRIRPEDPRFLDTLGVILLENDEPERAAETLEEAVSMAQEVPVLRYHLAQALVGTGRREEARRHLEAALSGEGEFPGSEEARALLAELRDES